MNSFYDPAIAWMALTSTGTFLTFLWLCRKRLVGIFDPLYLNSFYIACAYAYIGIAIWFGNPLGYHLSILLVIYLLVLFLMLNNRRDFCGPRFGEQLADFRRSKAAQSFALVCALVVLANDVFNIALSGYHAGVDNPNLKYLASGNSHLLFYLAFPLGELMFLFHYVFRGTRIGWATGLAFLLYPVFSFLSGDKSGMLLFFFQITWFYYLARIDGRQRRKLPVLKLMLAGAVLLPVSVVLVVISLASQGGGSTLTLFLTRLFIAFNQLTMATLFYLPIEQAHVSFFQLYFVSFLKMIGAYHLPFDGVGKYVFQTVFGNYVNGLSPNNNLALEAVMSFGYPAAIFVVALIAGLTGLAINYLYRFRYRSPLHLMLFGVVLTEPYGTLLAGSGNFTRLYALVFLYCLWLGIRGLVAVIQNPRYMAMPKFVQFPKASALSLDAK